LYLNRELQRKNRTAAGLASNKRTEVPLEQNASQVMTLRIDFVAKPGHKKEIASEVGELLSDSGLHREGLQASVLLVSDREVRVATLVTLWNAERFNPARERLTSWTLKLVARVADGPVRACTSVAHLLLPKESTKLTLSDLRPAEIAELVEILAAG